MLVPTLKRLPETRDTTDVFSGYNHTARLKPGEFYEMENLTADRYPTVCPRARRGIYQPPGSLTVTAPAGMVAKDGLCYIDGSTLVYQGTAYEMGLTAMESDDPKQLVSMGAYVIILPDRKYFNTADPDDRGDMGSDFLLPAGAQTQIRMCLADGTPLTVKYTRDTVPEDPENGDYWMDTSGQNHVLKQYSVQSGMWSQVTQTFVSLTCRDESQGVGVGEHFSPGDGVSVTGLETDPNADVRALCGEHIIYSRSDNCIVIDGQADAVRQSECALCIRRRIPRMDFVIECGNRLWGCRYGENEDGEFVNEIYASRLGDFKNWYAYQGLSTDSYCVSCGTDGPFTGAVNYLGLPLFFKENCLHKLYGSYPAEFQMQTVACRGVEHGSHRSLATVQEVLYYKGRFGICAYDGSVPGEISAPLGEIAYRNAVAGGVGSKYYISMADPAGKYHLFVYDARYRLWHREDSLRAELFCACGGELYYIDHADRASRECPIRTVSGSGQRDTAPVRWMAQTGVLCTDSPDRKYISRLNVRLRLPPGSRAEFFLRYDSAGQWHSVCTAAGTGLKSFCVPLRPRRCDHLELRICGVGDAEISGITKTVRKGSDRP